jgi:hypothetical protein
MAEYWNPAVETMPREQLHALQAVDVTSSAVE